MDEKNFIQNSTDGPTLLMAAAGAKAATRLGQCWPGFRPVRIHFHLANRDIARRPRRRQLIGPSSGHQGQGRRRMHGRDPP